MALNLQLYCFYKPTNFNEKSFYKYFAKKISYQNTIIFIEEFCAFIESISQSIMKSFLLKTQVINKNFRNYSASGSDEKTI